MEDDRDPPRLSFGEGPNAFTSDVMRHAEQDVATADQLSRLEARLGPLLTPGSVDGSGDGASSGTDDSATGGGSATGGASGTAGATSVGVSTWLTGAVALLVVAGGALYFYRPAEPIEEVREQPSVALPAVTPEEAAPDNAAAPSSNPASDVEPAAAPEPSAAAVTRSERSRPARSSARRSGRAVRRPAPVEPTRASPARGPSEVQLLDQGRAFLRGNPRAALAQAQEHRRRFATGTLVQEREVLAIDALMRLQRGPAAQRRAAAFERRFPDSGYLRRIRRLVGSSPPQPPR